MLWENELCMRLTQFTIKIQKSLNISEKRAVAYF